MPSLTPLLLPAYGLPLPSHSSYHGPLTYKALSRYVNEKFGADVAEEEDHLVVELDDMTFDRTVMNVSTHVMVKFYAYW